MTVPSDQLLPSDATVPATPRTRVRDLRPGPRISTTAIPHLRWPFRFVNRALADVEQDTIEDVEQSVHAYVTTPKGSRPLSPDFGVEDPTFSGSINAARLAAEIEESEDGRAVVDVQVRGPDENGRTSININVDLPE
jgi:hypothetical protein